MVVGWQNLKILMLEDECNLQKNLQDNQIGGRPERPKYFAAGGAE